MEESAIAGPVRQDYIERLVWGNIVELLKDPTLIQREIEKRIQEAKSSDSQLQQKELLVNQKTKLLQAMDKLLDAYQEDLVPIAELRKRMPDLQKRINTLDKEIETLQAPTNWD